MLVVLMDELVVVGVGKIAVAFGKSAGPGGGIRVDVLKYTNESMLLQNCSSTAKIET